ncbi:MAG: hypothetical protein SF123_08830 [Chloroflexota bacterium]|nr:hypothetical protein [Chloroflexota bacterium]
MSHHRYLPILSRGFTWLLLSLIAIVPVHAQPPTDPYLRNPRLGITFISSADHPANEQRYRQALLLGAGWNRFPIYWQWIETSPGNFDWSRYDRVVADDVRYGLQINAILLGIPDFQREGDIMRGLSEPVFSDGSNMLGGGKAINPNNPYASFVFQTVQRYKPGGTLAQSLGWRPDQGIRVWEAWNEPDLALFWTGGVQAYARLLQVTYLAARAADPASGVMFGGLAYINPEQSDWLDQTLAVIAQDPQRNTYNWYFDIAAVHSYSSAPRSGYVVRRARSTLARYGLTRPIWLNESGVPVWDDYPGPTWAANDPPSRLYRSTMAQQAAYVVQSTAYAWAAGAEVVFHHQLYDDCGNQPGGTDFPPGTTDRAGDAYGLFRNTGIEGCYTQHPQRGSARPAAAAFNLMARLFSGGAFSNGVILDLNGRGTVITFERAETSERIYVLWNRSTNPLTFDIPASGTQGMLYGVDNSDFVIFPNGTIFQIGTPPSRAGDEDAFGGNPFILVQTIDPRLQGVDPLVIALEDQAGNILTTAVAATPGPIVAQYGSVLAPALPLATNVVLPTIVPTATPDPTQPDTTPPTAAVLPLPVISPAVFTVRWSGQDDRGIEMYLIWVQVNGGEWQPWLETSDTQADHTGQPGSTYAFAAWARDTSGNWSSNTEIVAQATTAVR